MSPGRVEQGPPRERGLVQKADGYADYAEGGGGPGQVPPQGGGYPPSGPRGGELAGPVPRRGGPGGPPPGAPRRRRQRSIRSTITLLLIVPLVTLVALLGYSFYSTIPSETANLRENQVNADIGGPLEYLLAGVQSEASLTYLTYSLPQTKAEQQAAALQVQKQLAQLPKSELPAAEAQLKQQEQQAAGLPKMMMADRPKTDAAIAAFIAGQQKAEKDGVLPAQLKPLTASLIAELQRIPSLRAKADGHQADALTVLKGYIAVINAIFPYVGGTPNTGASTSLFTQAVGTLFMGQALTDVSDEIILGNGALEDGGVLTGPAYQLFRQTVDEQRALDQTGTTMLGFGNGNGSDAYVATINSAAFKSFQGLEDKIIANGPGARLPVTQAQWTGLNNTIITPLNNSATAERLTVTAESARQSRQTLITLYSVGGGGLLFVLLSALLLLRFGGRMSRELRHLRAAAQNLAFQRLPSVVARLGVGEDLDPVAEAPPLYLGTRTREITDTADAFSEVQRTAVQSAIQQAMLRKAVSNVFRRLARRNQGLLQRQLKMLDEMERGTQDPDALGQLFRLDHLTTRMRRQAEGLIILSGAAPGRTWRKPVPVVEVLRGAISEIEDYVRVDLLTDSPDYLQGAGVADVTHLLAELIENAVTYSPPATRVRVSGGRVANGYVVEVEDRGLGIQPEAMAALNQRLAEPPEFDVADSDQLGLFVVSRLADKQGIRVSLRPSTYGGTTAIVLLPASLVVSPEEAAYLSAQESMGHSSPGGNGGVNGNGGRGRMAAAMGAAADALSGRWRSKPDSGGIPAARNSGAMPAARDSGPMTGVPGASGLPTRGERMFGSGPRPVQNGGHNGGQQRSAPGGGFGFGGGGTGSFGGGAGNGGASGSGGYPSMPGGSMPGGSGGYPSMPGGSMPGGSMPGGSMPGGSLDGGSRDGSPGGPADAAGLPRRQRQTNMAPQLREQRPDMPKGPVVGKSPEQARSLLSNIQRGLQSGRNASVDPNGNGSSDGREMR